jgi:hypothetical protein
MKKKVNIILTMVMLCLWGTVGYKYVNRFFVSDEAPTLKEAGLTTNMSNKIKKDTFDLKPLGNDPFLNKRLSKPIIKAHVVTRYVAKPKLNPEPKKLKIITPFPTVKYFGFIKSQDKKEELILLKINNTLHKTRLNGNCDGIMVKKIYKDSVQVIFGKETRIIKK